MGELMNQWIYNIVIVVLFISFLEMLIPQGETKKYIRVVMSLLIILTIISPLLKMISPDWGTSLGFTGNAGSKVLDFSEIVSKGKELQANNQKSLKNEYEGLMAEQIRTLITMQKGIKQAIVKVETDEKTNRLNQIYIKVSKKSTPNTIKPVNVAEIEVNVKETLAESKNETDSEKNNIKTMIANLYNLEPEKITMEYI